MLRPPPLLRSFFATGLSLAAVGIAALGPVGCSPYQAPALSVDDAAARDETQAGLALSFTLTARNQNDVALPLRAANYGLELASAPGMASDQLTEVFEGVRSPEATLHPHGEQHLYLPAVIRLQDQAGNPLPRPTGIHRFRFWVQLTYITPGALAETLFDTGVRRPTAMFSQTGELDFGPGPGSPVRLAAPAPPEPPSGGVPPAQR